VFSIHTSISPLTYLSYNPNVNKYHPGSFVFLLFSLTAIATILYLPHHIMFLVGRAWFYIHGDSAVEAARETARSLAEKAAGAAAAAATTPTAKAIATETARAIAEGVTAGKVEL
jgi:hypothetical protein